MKEEDLRVIANLVDWQEADKTMKTTFYKCFGTVLQQKFNELIEAKANMKAFVEENFCEKLRKTPTRYNPMLKLCEKIQCMQLNELDSSGFTEDFSSNIVCEKNVVPNLCRLPNSVHFEQIDNDQMQPTVLSPKTPLMPIFKKPSSLKSGRCRNPTYALLRPLGLHSADLNGVEQRIITPRTPLHQIYETPLSRENKCSGKNCGSSDRLRDRGLHNIGPLSQQRDLTEREKIASRNREAFLSNRIEHTRSMRERGFERVRRNKDCSPRDMTPVSLLKPLCSVPAVSALPWDFSPVNATDKTHDVKSVQRSCPKVTIFDDDDSNNNSSRMNVSIANYEEATINELDKAILSMSEEGVEDQTETSGRVDLGVTFTVTPINKFPEMAKTPESIVKDTTFCNTKGISSYINAQRLYVTDEQISRHFGQICHPRLQELFSECASTTPDCNPSVNDGLTDCLSIFSSPVD